MTKILANLYSLYIKTQNYHWNVRGSDFIALHSLFEQQYTNLATKIDETAEIIRSSGELVPAGYAIFAQNSEIKDGNETLKSAEMVKELHDDYKKINVIIEKYLETVANETQKRFLETFFDENVKTIWMLNSIL